MPKFNEKCAEGNDHTFFVMLAGEMLLLSPDLSLFASGLVTPPFTPDDLL
jgi:hypothetical protein